MRFQKLHINRLLSLTLCLMFTLAAAAAGKAKYVFYFIGDGMGVNQVNGTQTYLAALEGRIGIVPLCFTQFPYSALVTTYSATNGVTDSAAAGTALATGHKTKNGALGVLADQQTPVNSVAVWAQQAGAAVGISTSVSIDHATPAAFYAHQGGRGSYYAIGKDLIKAGFDFYAGSDFITPNNPDHAAAPSLYTLCTEAGYTLTRGYNDFSRKMDKAHKLILLQTEEASRKDRNSIPYAIDRKPGDLSLTQITQAGITFLEKQQKQGFFLMVEGGKIDWACHANDAATAFNEVIDMDQAVSMAYEFYKQHPDETLIVVTADHETGGIALGKGPYELHTDVLQHQRMSTEAYGKHFQELHARYGQKLTWQQVADDLKQHWGLGSQVKLSEQQTKRLQKAYNDLMSGNSNDKKTLYAKVTPLAETARAIMAECALIGWESNGHSNGYVSVFAIGAGAEMFKGQIDNTRIPHIIAEAAGWTPQ